MSTLAILVPIAAFVGLIVAYALAAWIGKLDEGNERMKEIAGFVKVRWHSSEENTRLWQSL